MGNRCKSCTEIAMFILGTEFFALMRKESDSVIRRVSPTAADLADCEAPVRCVCRRKRHHIRACALGSRNGATAAIRDASSDILLTISKSRDGTN